jgi:hypothetical protein
MKEQEKKSKEQESKQLYLEKIKNLVQISSIKEKESRINKNMVDTSFLYESEKIEKAEEELKFIETLEDDLQTEFKLYSSINNLYITNIEKRNENEKFINNFLLELKRENTDLENSFNLIIEEIKNSNQKFKKS